MPVLDREEYIEQAYFFQAFRERLADGLPSQDILARVGEELLSTTRLPMAVSFLNSEIKVNGLMGPAMSRIGHYFTPFHCLVRIRQFAHFLIRQCPHHASPSSHLILPVPITAIGAPRIVGNHCSCQHSRQLYIRD